MEQFRGDQVDGREESAREEPELVVVQQREIPEVIRRLGTLAEPEYIDVFTLATDAGPNWSPEQWARAAFEDVAGLGGQFIWRVLLGMWLAWRPSPDHIAGWRIMGRGDDWILIEAHSWMLTGQLLIRIEQDQVSLGTFIRYDRRIAERIWTRLSAKHRSLAPGLLRGTLQILRSGTDR